MRSARSEVAPCRTGDGPCVSALCQKLPRAAFSFVVEYVDEEAEDQAKEALVDAIKSAWSRGR